MGKLGKVKFWLEQDGIYEKPRLWAFGNKYHAEERFVAGFRKHGVRLGCGVLFPCDGKISDEEGVEGEACDGEEPGGEI
jgi:hypothetical protein